VEVKGFRPTNHCKTVTLETQHYTELVYSFRPISNLTFLSKIIQRIATKQLTLHADQNELFPARQSAYRRFHFTESAVLVVHNDIIRAIDEGHVVALALLDLSSAFDTIDHPTVLSILQSRFSITGQPLEWFHSYLTGRTQVFTTHFGHTPHVPLITGVPQGSSQSNTTFSPTILSPTVTVEFLKLHY